MFSSAYSKTSSLWLIFSVVTFNNLPVYYDSVLFQYSFLSSFSILTVTKEKRKDVGFWWVEFSLCRRVYIKIGSQCETDTFNGKLLSPFLMNFYLWNLVSFVGMMCGVFPGRQNLPTGLSLGYFDPPILYCEFWSYRFHVSCVV